MSSAVIYIRSCSSPHLPCTDRATQIRPQLVSPHVASIQATHLRIRPPLSRGAFSFIIAPSGRLTIRRTVRRLQRIPIMQNCSPFLHSFLLFTLKSLCRAIRTDEHLTRIARRPKSPRFLQEEETFRVTPAHLIIAKQVAALEETKAKMRRPACTCPDEFSLASHRNPRPPSIILPSSYLHLSEMITSAIRSFQKAVLPLSAWEIL